MKHGRGKTYAAAWSRLVPQCGAQRCAGRENGLWEQSQLNDK